LIHRSNIRDQAPELVALVVGQELVVEVERAMAEKRVLVVLSAC